MLEGFRDSILFILFIIIITILVVTAINHFTQEDLKPVVKAHADVTFGAIPLEVSFSSLSYDYEGDIKKILWDFDDGTTGQKKEVTHSFKNIGTYHVVVSVWDESNQITNDTIVITTVNDYKPSAIITADKTCNVSPLQVAFTSEGTHINSKISTILWDFGDENTSEKQQVTHWFNNTGLYIVSLTIFFENGDIAYDSIQINVIESHIPKAYASANKMQTKAFQQIQFFGNCQDKDSAEHSYYWDFGDRILNKNQESYEQNPTHRFFFPGKYYVTLNVTDETGNSDWDTIIIEVSENFLSKSLSKIEDLIIDTIYTNVFPIISKIIDIHIGKFIKILY